MNDGVRPVTRLPVGFQRFHRRAFLSQLNRAHALGYAEATELREAAAAIRSQADCLTVFEALSRKVERDVAPSRHRAAA